jgi:hypothetical protein
LDLVLSSFEKLLGVKLISIRVSFFCFGEAQYEVNAYTNFLGCGQGQFFMRYLVIPIHYQRLTIGDLQLLNESKFGKDYKSVEVVGKGNCCPCLED